MMNPKPLWRSLVLPRPHQTQSELKCSSWGLFVRPSTILWIRCSIRKIVIKVSYVSPEGNLRNSSFVFPSVLSTISWKAKGDAGRQLAKGKQIETQTLYSKTPSTGHAKLLVPVNAEWIMGREGENLLRKCWKMWHFHFQDVADMLKTPLSAHLAQLEHCKNQTLPVIFFPFANQHILQHSFLPLAGREVSGVTIQLW